MAAPSYARDCLAAFSHALKYDAIPDDAVHAAKRFLLDSLACIVGGWNEPSARIARAAALEFGGRRESRILLTGERCRRSMPFSPTVCRCVRSISSTCITR